MITTLAYIEKQGRYLMLHRDKDKQDFNYGKWLGVGGKLEKDESPVEAMKREVYEETGLEVLAYQMKGIITFVNSICETEYIILFVVSKYQGELIECQEGSLHWIEKNKVLELNLWAGDRYFLEPLMAGELDQKLIHIKFVYDGDQLLEVISE